MFKEHIKKTRNSEKNDTRKALANSYRITSILIDSDVRALNILENKLKVNCPFVEIKGKLNSIKKAEVSIAEQSPDLVFLGIGRKQEEYLDFLNRASTTNFETVFVTEEDYLDSSVVLQYNASGCLLKPIQEIQLLRVLQRVQQKIGVHKEYFRNKELMDRLLSVKTPNNVIGIPTMEGYEFLVIQNIIRCESYMKCTRVIADGHIDIISSYNIGQFTKALSKHGFYPPHQSHIINLSKVKKYLNEGTVVMQDNSFVPVARRRRNEFLNRIPHL